MNQCCVSKSSIKELFREEALLIGSLAANYDMNDDLIWELCRNLDLIRIRFIKKHNQYDRQETSQIGKKLHPHPAVQELLRKIKDE